MRAYLETFGALLARDIRVLTRNFGQFLIRTIMQPLLFVFVFAYVFPKIGQGFHGGANGVAFSTILVPGLIAVAINFQGIQAVALPLVQEFSISREIEDRVLAPVPVWVVGFEKIFAGTVLDPRKVTLLFAVVVLPLTFLGCVYYPWAALTPVMWLKIVVLLNPLVYMTEGLRASLTPELPHMPVWAFMLALVGGTVGLAIFSLQTFRRRVVT